MNPLWRGGCEKSPDGSRSMLQGFLLCKRSFDWKENGKINRLDCRENDADGARRYLPCLATDAGDKRHRLFFPEGRGFLKGWSLLAEKLRGLGLRKMQEAKSVRSNSKIA